MNAQDMERMCRAANMAPVGKRERKDYTVYVADGFSAFPEKQWRRFEVTNREFPFGAYCTMWWIAEETDKMLAASPMIFDAMHDKGWTAEDKKRGRIEAAYRAADQFIRDRLNVRKRKAPDN